KVFEARQTLRSALVVAGLAYMPRVLERAVAMVEVMFRDVSAIDGQNRLTWGVGRFLDPDTVEPSSLAVLMRIDLFTIWVTVLLAIGLAVTGRINRQRAAIAGVLMWLIGAIPTFFAMLRA
ncbi:MAG TPA: YIP1 family protein, partial [Gemmatimonadaceae bacterium]|nr:YIP1 family protein [Gemmatimonadaceae bacterium]